MQDLVGTVGRRDSVAFGVSADGLVVVGRLRNSRGDWRAFRWSAHEGVVDIGSLGGDYSSAHAVSSDGSVVVGRAWYSNSTQNWHAFRWSAQGGMQDLGTLPGGYGGRLLASPPMVVWWSERLTPLRGRCVPFVGRTA